MRDLLRNALEGITFSPRGFEDIRACGSTERHGERCLSAKLYAGTDYLARALSLRLGGQWWVGPSAVTWVNGRNCCWLVDSDAVARACEARAFCVRLGASGAGWTIGSCARALLRWAVPPQAPTKPADELRPGKEWGYHHCEPGIMEAATLYDLDSAYWHLLKRLPSPHITPLPKRLIFHPLAPDARERWALLLSEIRLDKGLRNTLVGTMAGSEGGAKRYCRGEVIPWSGARGPLRAAAHLVVRTCYELTGLAVSETKARYANTDCVITEQGRTPSAWGRHGLPYSVRAEGEGDVRAVGIYRVGWHQTKLYGASSRWQPQPCVSPWPERLRLADWL
jgi:hypothetical protein